MRKKKFEIMEWLGYIGACVGFVFSSAWFWVLGFWAATFFDNVILKFVVIIVPSFLGIGLMYLSNRMIDYSKRKLGKKY